MSQFDQDARQFAEAGNRVVGAPRALSGTCSITGTSAGSTLIFGKDVDLCRVTLQFNKGGGSIEFQDGCRPFGKFIVEGGSRIVIGADTRFNKLAWFQALEGTQITVGKKCLFADIRVRTSDVHSILDLADGRRLNLARDVTIGNRVWIAEKAHIYKGVVIGPYSVIGAHSVVTRSIPPNSVAVGNPAKVVRSGITWVRKLTGPEGDPSMARP